MIASALDRIGIGLTFLAGLMVAPELLQLHKTIPALRDKVVGHRKKSTTRTSIIGSHLRFIVNDIRRLGLLNYLIGLIEIALLVIIMLPLFVDIRESDSVLDDAFLLGLVVFVIAVSILTFYYYARWSSKKPEFTQQSFPRVFLTLFLVVARNTAIASFWGLRFVLSVMYSLPIVLWHELLGAVSTRLQYERFRSNLARRGLYAYVIGNVLQFIATYSV